MFSILELKQTNEYWQELLENNFYALNKKSITKKQFIEDVKKEVMELIKLKDKD